MRAAIGLFAAVAVFGASGAGYHLLKKIPIGGAGGWDYIAVDAEGRRVFVSHGMEVDVLDADSLAVAGKIDGLHGVHGIAIARDLGRGFISNGQSSTVTVFDLKTLEKIGGEVATGENPDAILYHKGTGQVFAFNGRSKSASVIDAKTAAVVGVIELGGKPEFSATDGTGAVYVNIEDTNELVRLDPAGRSVAARWPLKPCEEPSGLALDAKSKRLFVGCGNKMMAVVDAGNGNVITTVPIGGGVDATAFDPAAGLIFDSCGDGTTTVASASGPDAYQTETVKTQKGARTMAVDPKTHRLFLPIADFAPPAEGQRRPSIVPGSFAVLVYEQ